MPTHAEKNRGRRVLFPLKRANISPFGLYDRAAGPISSHFACRVITTTHTKMRLVRLVRLGVCN
jgi:hypothetical protein